MRYPKPSEWPDLISEYRASGLQAKEVAAKHDLALSTHDGSLGALFNSAQLAMLLDGIDLSRVRRPKKWSPEMLEKDRQTPENLINTGRWYPAPRRARLSTTANGARMPKPSRKSATRSALSSRSQPDAIRSEVESIGQLPADVLAEGRLVLHRRRGSLADGLALPLRDSGQDVENQPPRRAPGVDLLANREQRRFSFREVLLDQVAKVHNPSGQPVQFHGQEGGPLPASPSAFPGPVRVWLQGN